jgi:hypothetical protein
MAEQHYLAAQKAIDGLRLSFKNNKKPKPAVERLHPAPQQEVACDCCAAVAVIIDNATPCDCCGTISPQGGLTMIDSGQKLCQNCLEELRG